VPIRRMLSCSAPFHGHSSTCFTPTLKAKSSCDAWQRAEMECREEGSCRGQPHSPGPCGMPAEHLQA